jgi:hypothetical protein
MEQLAILEQPPVSLHIEFYRPKVYFSGSNGSAAAEGSGYLIPERI